MNVDQSAMAPPSLTKPSETSSASSAVNVNECDGLSYSVCRSEVRLLELNRCLQLRGLRDSTNWCEQLTADFFTDDACLTITVATGGNPSTPKLFTVKRNFIPKYFNSLFHGGVTEVAFLPGPVVFENPTGASVLLECEQACMLAHHNKPFSAQVVTRGKLSLEMTADYRRFRTWHFSMEACQEYISCDEGAPLYQALGMRHTSVGEVDPAAVQKLECGLTQRGLTPHTLQFLQIQSVLQPMQVLIAHHKATNLPPRECMRAVLASSGPWPQRTSVAAPGTSRPPTVSTPMDAPTTTTSTTTTTSNRRQKRRGSRPAKASTSGVGQAKKSSPDPTQVSNVVAVAAPVPASDAPSPFPHSLPTGFPVPGELMTVGEPIMMGGDTYTKEDERLIARVENPQYEHFEPSPASAVMSSMPMASPATPKLAIMSQATTNVGPGANQSLDVCNGMGFSAQY